MAALLGMSSTRFMTTFVWMWSALCIDIVLGKQAPVLVTGATGPTGSLVYLDLKRLGVPVRAFVRSQEKARRVLGCITCEEDEGIYLGDVTQPKTLTSAVEGIGALVIVTSAVPQCGVSLSGLNCTFSPGGSPEEVDWRGGLNQIAAVASAATLGGAKPFVAFVSSMATTKPKSMFSTEAFGYIGFYKLNVEAALMSSGLPYMIVKPTGLTNADPGKRRLVAGRRDNCKGGLIPRSDVARLVAMSVTNLQPTAQGLYFDLCSSSSGSATGGGAEDIEEVLLAAKQPWISNGQRVHSAKLPGMAILVSGLAIGGIMLAAFLVSLCRVRRRAQQHQGSLAASMQPMNSS